MSAVVPLAAWLAGFFAALLFAVLFVSVSWVRRFLKSSSSDFR